MTASIRKYESSIVKCNDSEGRPRRLRLIYRRLFECASCSVEYVAAGNSLPGDHFQVFIEGDHLVRSADEHRLVVGRAGKCNRKETLVGGVREDRQRRYRAAADLTDTDRFVHNEKVA